MNEENRHTGSAPSGDRLRAGPQRGCTTSEKFALGEIVATPAALEALSESGEEAASYIARHAGGDWGIVGKTNAHLNDLAVQSGARIFSTYILQSGVRIWIMTEADRSATTILLPEDY